MANSYNGWFASPVPNEVPVGPFNPFGIVPFANGGFAGGVHVGDVHDVFMYLVTRLHTEVEPIMKDPNTGQLGYGCWGYGYRANVNNPSTLSCHASGTAIDYNATLHPNGTSTGPNGGGGWSGTQYRKVQEILVACGGSVRWLTSNDPMHFEIYGSASVLRTNVLKLGGTPSNPEPPVIPSEDDMPYTEQQLKQFAHDGTKWALEDPNVDPVIIRALVQQELAKMVGGTADFQQFKQAVHDGAKWAIEDPATNHP